MAEVSNQTLVLTIQAIAAEIRALREAIAEGEAEPEEQLLLEDRVRAAGELEDAYDKAARVAINLPPYDELVR